VATQRPLDSFPLRLFKSEQTERPPLVEHSLESESVDRLYVVKRLFTATTVWVSATPRIFRPGETLWWDPEGFSDLFKVDGFKWYPEDAVQFSKNIEPFESCPSSLQSSENPS